MLTIKETLASRPSWDQVFFTQAMIASLRSIDTSSQVGAVIVNKGHVFVSQGYNGPVRGMDVHDETCHYCLTSKPEKYFYFEHAERNAIYNAHRVGASVKDCTLYVTLFPCPDCARSVVQSGITSIKVLEQTNNMHSIETKHSLAILHAAKVKLQIQPTALVTPLSVRMAGTLHTFQ